VNTATIEEAQDRTAGRAEIYSRLGPTAFAFTSTPDAYPYALPPWGILVIRCEEKTVITDTIEDLEDEGPKPAAEEQIRARQLALAGRSRQLRVA